MGKNLRREWATDMAKWLLAECKKCGQFWALETLQRKIEFCSRCKRPLSKPPKNLIYSKEDLEEEEEELTDEFTDFEYHCRCQLTSSGEQTGGMWAPGEFRRPTRKEISERGEYAVDEVEFYHDQVKRIADHYFSKGLRYMAWMTYWDDEYEKSTQRLQRLRHHFGGIFNELVSSGYRFDELIRRSMTDLWTSEWFANKENSEPVKKCRYRLKLPNQSVVEAIAEEEKEIKEESLQQNIHENLYGESWSTEELARNAQFCLSDMKRYRKHLKKNVNKYRSEAPPPVNADTKIIWREGGGLMHLTLVHPLEDGTDAIEVVGTNYEAIRNARSRIEAARWLGQAEEDFNSHMERENRMMKHLDGIADILDELNYRDRYLEDFIDYGI